MTSYVEAFLPYSTDEKKLSDFEILLPKKWIVEFFVCQSQLIYNIYLKVLWNRQVVMQIVCLFDLAHTVSGIYVLHMHNYAVLKFY
jgi:hypothetical protein